MFDLTGKTALVTGATGGIGKAIVEAFATTGAKVLAVDLDQSKVDDVVSGLEGSGHIGMAANVGDYATHQAMIDRAIAEFGNFYCLTNAAAVLRRKGSLDEVTEEDWDFQHDINLKAAFFLSRTAGNALIAQGKGGRIILFSSQGWWTGGFAGWWWRSFTLPEVLRLPLNHLWFVLYIGVYTFAAVALLTRPAVLQALERGLERALAGRRVLLVPIAYLAAARLTLFPVFGITNQLPVDWYNHAVSLAVFVFGFAVAMREAVWKDLERYRLPALVAALATLVLLMAFTAHPDGRAFYGIPKGLTYAANQWLTIAAILGYGSALLRRADGPLLRYLTDAVFPCYLAHQTILVVAAYLVKDRGLPAVPEALLLLSVTLGGSVAVYEIVRRLGPLRPLWGLKRRPRPAAPQAVPAAAGQDADPARAA